MKLDYKLTSANRNAQARSKRLRGSGGAAQDAGVSALAQAIAQKADKADTLAGYGITDAYTKDETDATFVTVETDQAVNGAKEFTKPVTASGGVAIPAGKSLKIGNIEIEYDAEQGGIHIKGGGLYSDDYLTAEGINGSGGSGTSGGLNTAQLLQYLTDNGYITEDWIKENVYVKPEIDAFLATIDTTLSRCEKSISSLWRGVMATFDGIMPADEFRQLSSGKTGAVTYTSKTKVYWVPDIMGNDGRFVFHDTENDIWGLGASPYHYCATDGAAEYFRHGRDIYRLCNVPNASRAADHRHELVFIGSLSDGDSGRGLMMFDGVVDFDMSYNGDDSMVEDPDAIIYVRENPDHDEDPMAWNGGFVASKNGIWYKQWAGASEYCNTEDPSETRPADGNVYVNRGDNRLYIHDGSGGIVAVDAYAHDAIDDIRDNIASMKATDSAQWRGVMLPIDGIIEPGNSITVTDAEPGSFSTNEIYAYRQTDIQGVSAIQTDHPLSAFIVKETPRQIQIGGSASPRWITATEYLKRLGYDKVTRFILDTTPCRFTSEIVRPNVGGLIGLSYTRYTIAPLIDDALNPESVNPVQNRVIAQRLAEIESTITKNEGGSVLAHRFGTDDFETSVRAALAYAKENGFSTVDCSWFSGEWECQDRFILDFPVNLRLGNVTVTMADTMFFEIRSNNVRIQGVNRQTDRTVTDGNATVLILAGVSNLSNEGYHIYSRGNKNCQYRDMVLKGKQTTSGRQCGNSQYPIDGTGGIYIEKANPGTTSSGNTCNATIIDNILIDGTKAHAIYIDTPILSMIRDVRISYAGGHGVFISGGTSTTLESVYVASARYAGFCLQGITYCTVFNSVAENCGCGWWLRSVFNTSLFSPGVETTYNYGLNPWAASYSVSKRYGLAVDTTNAEGGKVKITDVPDENWAIGSRSIHARSLFCGYAFVVTGGRNVDVYSPYCISIANELTPSSPKLSAVKDQLCFMLVLGNSRAVKVSNALFNERNTSPIPAALRHEIEIAAEASALDLSYNPDSSNMPSWTAMSPVTDDETKTAPVLCLSKTALVHCGNRFYTKVVFAGNIEVAGSAQVAGQLVTDTGIITKGPIINYDEAALNVLYSISPDSIEVDYTYDGTLFKVIPKATFALDNVTEETQFKLLVDGVERAATTGGNEMSFKLSSPGEHSIVMQATWGDKTAQTEPRAVTVKQPSSLPVRFIATEIVSAEAASVLLRITYQGTYVVTEAGIAYSSNNQSPTTSQNSRKLSSLDLITDDADGITHSYEISLPRSNASTVRYVRGYVRAKEDADATSAYPYYDTTVYKVVGPTIETL